MKWYHELFVSTISNLYKQFLLIIIQIYYVININVTQHVLFFR